jgi:hypothetical protein
LVRGTASAFRRDPQFRALVVSPRAHITLVGGTIFYNSLEEGWSVVDAFYFFSVTTLTTVGLLGDLTPKTTLGKLFTVVSTSWPGWASHLGVHRHRGQGDLEASGSAEGR